MTEAITIEPFDPMKNEEILLDVHAAHFTGGDSTSKRRAYVPWLLSNPVHDSIYLAAYVDGAFASFLGFMAREVVGFGRTFRGALAFGAMTLPQFGGRGLYRRLAHAGWEEARRRGFHFAMGYTIRPYVLDMELRMGWSNMGAAPVLALPLDAPATVRSALPRFAGLAGLTTPAGLFFRSRAVRRAARLTGEECSVAQVESFSPDLEVLTDALRQADHLTFAKDRRTLDWLYLSPHNPFDYDIVEARRAGELVGFAVGRRMDLMGLDGYGVLDLIAFPGRDDVLAPLAAALVQIALTARPQIVAALVSRGDAAYAALRYLGFIDSRRTFTLIYRPVTDELPVYVSYPENWANFWGNNDTV
jgi:hypothetical protein